MQQNTAPEDRPHAVEHSSRGHTSWSRIQLQRTDLMQKNTAPEDRPHSVKYSSTRQTSCSRRQLQRTDLIQQNTAPEDRPHAVEDSSRGQTSSSRIQLQRTDLIQQNTAPDDTPHPVEYWKIKCGNEACRQVLQRVDETVASSHNRHYAQQTESQIFSHTVRNTRRGQNCPITV